MSVVLRPPNDPRQYDDLRAAWWDAAGPLAALHWLAEARGRLVPAASRAGAVLVDVGCGGGLTAPHVAGKGYRHIGVDIGAAATATATDHGVLAVQGDAHRLPVRDGVADVVVAGEILEHVTDLEVVVGEIARVLRPGGTVVIDTLADTRACRFLMVTVGERIGVVPRGIHDPRLFVTPRRLVELFRRDGITLEVRGLRPSVRQGLAWLVGRRRDVAMRDTRFTGVVYQGVAVKAAA